jgi:hypothetical protein
MPGFNGRIANLIRARDTLTPSRLSFVRYAQTASNIGSSPRLKGILLFCERSKPLTVT